jgi:hypothetical protein
MQGFDHVKTISDLDISDGIRNDYDGNWETRTSKNYLICKKENDLTIESS